MSNHPVRPKLTWPGKDESDKHKRNPSAAGSVIPDLMAAVAAGMRTDLAQSTVIHHSGGKGRAREELILRFLRKYGPQNVQYTQGAEIVAADGTRSFETDVVVHDRSVPPFVAGVHSVLLNESVYGVKPLVVV